MEFTPYSPKTSALKLALPGWQLVCCRLFFAVLASQGRIFSGETGGGAVAKMAFKLVAFPSGGRYVTLTARCVAVT